MIVVVTPTIMDGPVVRWYLNENAEARGAEAMSASRNGVQVNVFLHLIPEDAMATAISAYATLRSDRNAGSAAVSHLATHCRRGIFGPLEPIEVQA